jgi:hypothetical protein
MEDDELLQVVTSSEGPSPLIAPLLSGEPMEMIETVEAQQPIPGITPQIPQDADDPLEPEIPVGGGMMSDPDNKDVDTPSGAFPFFGEDILKAPAEGFAQTTTTEKVARLALIVILGFVIFKIITRK